MATHSSFLQREVGSLLEGIFIMSATRKFRIGNDERVSGQFLAAWRFVRCQR